jgi:sugar lactone lactonase YvrE
MQMKEIEVFSDCHDLLGESPRWHPNENRLYWVDIESGLVHSQATEGKTPENRKLSMKVGCLAFEKSGGFLLATSKGILSWNSDRSILTPLVDPEPGKSGARFNDGLVDANGRFWAGTMTETDASSCLYRLDPDLSINKMVTGVTISNGIGWNKESTRMYFTDTMKHVIWLYDFNLLTGTLSNQRVFLEVDGPGLPDGLAVDTDGNVWIALCGSGIIQVHDPAGVLLNEIHFPTKCITACTFGGTGLTELFVTSSRSLLESNDQLSDPLAGSVFRIATRSHGIPDHLFG